jgi:2-polyprenyl-3-methyl-5-hydroxy-6-metoxy-1,4-benzoquinol methylase
MKMDHFKEYNWQVELKQAGKLPSLGLTSGSTYLIDPKRLVFTLSRYKFVSKMLDGFDRVLEVGCGDGFASRIVRASVNSLTAIDIENEFIEDAKLRIDENLPIEFKVHNILEATLEGSFDGIYSLDVLEHIPATLQDSYLKNVLDCLSDEGVLILGMPSIESQEYASGKGNNGHINCQSGRDLRNTLKDYFHNVFLFSMNDEVVHTGFDKMAHYILCVCTSKKS